MKFKLLKEKFDYNSTALADAYRIKERLQFFIDDLDATPHADEFLTSEDISTLKKSIEILDRFYTGYNRDSYRAALKYFNDK